MPASLALPSLARAQLMAPGVVGHGVVGTLHVSAAPLLDSQLAELDARGPCGGCAGARLVPAGDRAVILGAVAGGLHFGKMGLYAALDDGLRTDATGQRVGMELLIQAGMSIAAATLELPAAIGLGTALAGANRAGTVRPAGLGHAARYSIAAHSIGFAFAVIDAATYLPLGILVLDGERPAHDDDGRPPGGPPPGAQPLSWGLAPFGAGLAVVGSF